MSDLPSHALDYQAVVAEYFLGLRGAGLLLSPLDQELVAEWERRGLPVAVVCRGLRQGAAELAEDRRPLRSLRAVRGAVEAEWRAYRSGRVGDSPAPSSSEEELAARRLAEADARLAEAAARGGPLRDAYLGARSALLAHGPAGAGPEKHLEVGLAAADAWVLSAWLGTLARPERAALGARVRLLAGARRRGESPRAYRRALRAHLLDLAGQAGLTWLSGSV